jgi:hypothetical protein
MRWKISIEGSDEITRGHRFEFETEKSLDDLIAGNIGLSIDEGKAIMASLQPHIIEQQCALYVLFRRHCQGCGGTRDQGLFDQIDPDSLRRCHRGELAAV